MIMCADHHCNIDLCGCDADEQYRRAQAASPPPPASMGEGLFTHNVEVEWNERIVHCAFTAEGLTDVEQDALCEHFDALLSQSGGGDGWRTIDSAPKDGTPILAWTVHANAKYSKDPVGEGWACVSLIRWIDFNGGGWTWNGLAGEHTHWRPLPAAPTPQVKP